MSPLNFKGHAAAQNQTREASGYSSDSNENDIVAKAKKIRPEPYEYSYNERDVILYNLGAGATEKQVGSLITCDVLVLTPRAAAMGI